MKSKLVVLLSLVIGTHSVGCGSKSATDSALTISSAGAVGPTGASGASISSVRYCSKVSLSRLFEYSVTTYSNGDVSTFCTIADSFASYTEMRTFRSTQVGATTQACSLIYDLDAGTSGFWTFGTSGSVPKATYNDSGSASNGTTVTFASSDCTTS